ncbi:murein hydrolase activator EnvC family protein [Romboutsia sp.]|uniref:murein hydrolase activator EnvC family protein n=1 Tax=Romboutsia sp. TaxID=1965302 RepID=UPI003F2E7197
MKKILSILTVCSMLFTTNFVYADNKEEKLDKQLTENRQEQEDIAGKIKGLDTKVAEIEKNIEDTNAKIGKIDSEIESTKSEIKILEEKIAKNEELLGQRLKVISSNYSIGYMKVILSSDSLSDFFNNIYMVKQVVEQDKVLLKELDENKLLVKEKEKELETKKKNQEDLKLSLQNDNEAVKADKAELESLKSKLEKEEESLEGEVEKLAAQSKVDVENGAVISSGSWPVPGHSRVSSPYGYRLHPVLNVQKMHTGIDIPAPEGTPAVAIDSGTVIFSGVQGSYGNTVMIQHDDGKVTLYAHNSALLVSVGQRVEKGQVVTRIGSTGRSTGPHLHFEVRINGKHTNPMGYIN